MGIVDKMRFWGIKRRLLRKPRKTIYIFGETHAVKQHRVVILQKLEELVSLNKIDALALECFNKEDQEILDKYLQREARLANLKETLSNWWPEYYREYLRLCAFARVKRLSLIAVDDRETHEPDIDRLDHLIDEVEDKIEKNPFDDNYDKLSKLELNLNNQMRKLEVKQFKYRNRVIVKTMLDHPAQNIALVIGSVHVEEVTDLLRKAGCVVIPEIIFVDGQEKIKEEFFKGLRHWASRNL